MKENSPVHQLGNFVDRPWGVSEIGGSAVGRTDLHLHDLRHSGLTWSAALGATTAELMYRAGHKSPAAALRYQHAAQDRDELLADALGTLAQGTLSLCDGHTTDTIRRRYMRILPLTKEQPQRDSNPCRHLERVVS